LATAAGMFQIMQYSKLLAYFILSDPNIIPRSLFSNIDLIHVSFTLKVKDHTYHSHRKQKTKLFYYPDLQRFAGGTVPYQIGNSIRSESVDCYFLVLG
jgi:hypothetical protein